MDRTIGKKYKLIEVVGEGGMNTVYKAENLETGDLVAIKILKGDFNKDQEVVKRFHLESEAIQKLNHDNIVKVLDIGEENGEHYIVMELLKTQTLKNVIEANEKYFNNIDIVYMSLQILRGIQKAHDNNIVHRDIKPQNILIDKDGKLKVSDFGIARVVDSDTMENLKDAIGSVHYASPEQSRGSIVDERSDIYSFGIVLYELATGRLPFDGDSAISIALKHTKSQMVDPCHLNLNLNPSIDLIIKKCIQKEPAQRFQTINELIDLFEEIRKNPDKELGPEFSELFVVPTETIDMKSIAPFLDGEKEEKNKVEVLEERNKVNFVPMLITMTAAVLVGFLVLAFIFIKPNKEVENMKPFELDDLVGMNFTEASTLLASKRLNIEQIATEYNEEVGVNRIISQIPHAGAVVKEGTTVKVRVSLGKEEYVVPKLYGLSIQEAKVKLNNARIKFKLEEEYSKEDIGTVTKQWPKQGTILAKDEEVIITMSLGSEPEMHIMPALRGMHLDSATKKLTSVNLIVGETEYSYDDTVEKDYVLWQSISPNVSVEENTVVNLRVSRGKQSDEEAEDEEADARDDEDEENEGKSSSSSDEENNDSALDDNTEGEDEDDGEDGSEGETNNNDDSDENPSSGEEEKPSEDDSMNESENSVDRIDDSDNTDSNDFDEPTVEDL